MFRFLNNLEVKKCNRCSLRKEEFEIPVGWGTGNKFMVLGLAPSCHSDTKHEFAIKPTSELDTANMLFNCLRDLGYNEKDFYITNIIKCYLEDNRKPEQNELNYCCNQWLSKEIFSVSPYKIICLGSIVYEFIKEKDTLKSLFEIHQVYHHSYIARNRNLYGEWIEQWKEILI